MPFSDEDKILIKHYHLDKRYGRKRLLAEFPEIRIGKLESRPNPVDYGIWESLSQKVIL